MTRSKTVEINSLWEWKGWNGDRISAVVDDEHSGITGGVIKMDDSAATAVRLLCQKDRNPLQIVVWEILYARRDK